MDINEIIKDFKQFLIDKNIIDLYISSLAYELIDNYDEIEERQNVENLIETTIKDFCDN